MGGKTDDYEKQRPWPNITLDVYIYDNIEYTHNYKVTGKNPATLTLSTELPYDPPYPLLSKPWPTTIHHCAREKIFGHLDRQCHLETSYLVLFG